MTTSPDWQAVNTLCSDLSQAKSNGPQLNVSLVSLVCLGNRKGLKITPGSAGTPTISSPFNGLSGHF